MRLKLTFTVTLYIIKHIISIKLIWCFNDIPNWSQSYAAVSLTIKVIYKLAHGHIRRLPGRMAKMGVLVTRRVSLPCIWSKRISIIKLISCVSDISNSGQAYVTIWLINKVLYIRTPGHKRRHLGLLAKMRLKLRFTLTLNIIKHIITIKLIWCFNDIPNCGQAYASIGLIIKVIYKLAPGHIRRLLGWLSKMGVLVTLRVSLPCIW